MGIATLLSRMLGLVREQVMAFYFGASGLTDAFLVAYRIPNLLRDLFAEGAFSSAFVPTFTEARKEKEERAKTLLWSLFVLLLLVTGALSLGIYIFADDIVRLFAPSFLKNPAKFKLTVELVQIMAPFLLLVSLAALFMGALNSLKVFFIPSLAPAVFNIVMISSMVIGANYLWGDFEPIKALAIGVVLGGVAQGLMQVPMLFKKGYLPRKIEIHDPRVKIVFKKLGPGLIGFAATQINLIINTVLASSAGVGAVSWLSYAFRLFQFPVGVVGVSVANSNLVHFSDAWKENNKEQAMEILKSSILISLFGLILSLALLGALSEITVSLIFERGRFTLLDTRNTSIALNFYLLGLPFYGLYKILVPVFYTIDRQNIPVVCSIGGIIFNIVFCVSLVDTYGYSVLALGTSLSIFLNSMAQFIVLKRITGSTWELLINKRNIKILVSGILSFALLKWLSLFFAPMLKVFSYKLLGLGALGAIGVFSYLSLLYIFGERELIQRVLGKILRKK